MKKVKVGVIGVGNIGRHHARVFSELPEAELIGIVDTQYRAVKPFAEKLKVPLFNDYKKLFGEVDAVSIATPTSLHYNIAIDCLLENIHVLVEKPITVDVKEAREIIGLANKKELVLQVGHLERFNPATLKLKELIEAPYFISAKRVGFSTERNLDVGVVWDLMIHDLDIIINLISSPVEDIQAIGMSVYSAHEDIALVELLFRNGCMASLQASRISGEKERILEVVEKNRTLSLDFINQSIHVMRPSSNKRTTMLSKVNVKKGEPLRLELEHFLDCIIRHKKPMVSGEDGKRALELAVKICNSMKIVKRRKVGIKT